MEKNYFLMNTCIEIVVECLLSEKQRSIKNQGKKKIFYSRYLFTKLK